MKHRWKYDHGRGGAMVCTECGAAARVDVDGQLVQKKGSEYVAVNAFCYRTLSEAMAGLGAEVVDGYLEGVERASKTKHVCEWARTGPDTLFCWGCLTELQEPEDK